MIDDVRKEVIEDFSLRYGGLDQYMMVAIVADVFRYLENNSYKVVKSDEE